MADVFISYAREDRNSAEKLAHALEAHGWSVWWDRDILPGKDFSAVISAEIAAARSVVVLWSKASVASHWVRDEAHEGLERNVLVPVLLDGSEPPMGYRAFQGVDLKDWEPGREHLGFTQLIEAITALLHSRRSAAVGRSRRVRGHPAAASVDQTEALRRRRRSPPALRWPSIIIFVFLNKKDEAPRPPLLGTVRSFKDCDDCPEMVALNAGRFRMGASWLDREAQSDERPIVDVAIERPFAIGRTEVTFAEWDACVADHGCNKYSPDDHGWGRGRMPVIYVSWEDAGTYVDWLKKKTGKAYRLPTEAEWEYACRAGTETKYPFGNQITPELANYNRAFQHPREVASYPPNGWGLYDMNGNVWEWVEDRMDDQSQRPTRRSVGTARWRSTGPGDPRRLVGRPATSRPLRQPQRQGS